MATESLESRAACWGRLICRDRTSTVVSFCALASLRPTLCFFLAKSWLPLALAGRLMPLPMAPKQAKEGRARRLGSALRGRHGSAYSLLTKVVLWCEVQWADKGYIGGAAS